MLKPVLTVVVGILLLSTAGRAADYKCAQAEVGKRLNDYDIQIKNQESVVAEIKEEITQSGGATDQHKKALQTFEEKVAKARVERETLLNECKEK